MRKSPIILAVASLASVIGVGVTTHLAPAGCYLQSAPVSCTNACTTWCPGEWEPTYAGNSAGLEIPDEKFELRFCEYYGSGYVATCGSTPGGYVPMNCNVYGSGTLCCYRPAWEYGEPDDVYPAVVTVSDGAYSACSQPNQ